MEGLGVILSASLISLLWLPIAMCGETVTVHQSRDPSNSCTFPNPLGLRIVRNANDDVTLTLKTNEVILVPSRIMLVKTDEVTGETIIEPMEIPQTSVAYHSYENEASFVVNCHKHRRDPVYTFDGTFFVGDAMFHLYPADTAASIGLDDVTQDYVMDQIVESEATSGIDSLKFPSAYRTRRNKSTEDSNPHHRAKREVIDYYIDVVPFLDYYWFTRWMARSGGDFGKATTDSSNYITNIFTGMALRYKTLSLHNNIVLNIQMGSPYLFLNATSSWFTEDNKIDLGGGNHFVNIDNQLTNFTQFLVDQSFRSNYDHAMLFTGYEWYNTDVNSPGSILGLAWVGSTCDQDGYSSSIVVDRMGYQSEGIATHELGHSLGALHDGADNNCSAHAQYVMAAYSASKLDTHNLRNPFNFSSCSSDEISDYIQWLEETEFQDSCLLSSDGSAMADAPSSTNRIEDLCPSYFGNGSSLCITDDDDSQEEFLLVDRFPLEAQYVCTTQYCRMDNGNCDHVIPPSGTCCGNGQYCVQGVCSPAPEGDCVMDEVCPFPDHERCNTTISNNFTVCFNEVINSFCCRYCANRLDYAVIPPGPPSILIDSLTIANGQQVTVDYGDVLKVSCSVAGGEPLVREVTIACDGMDAMTNDDRRNKVETNVTATQNLQHAQCVCSAVHLTGQYDQTSSFVIDIRDFPPPSRPELTVNGDPVANDGDDVTVYVDDNMKVDCMVAGGYPEVTNITFGCTGVDSITKDGASLTSWLVVSKQHMGVVCTCWADHTTGQYRKTMTFTINVQDPPQIRGYSINSSSHASRDIQVTAGQGIEFVCEAYGLPAPNVSVKMASSGSALQGTVGTSTTSPTDEYTKVFTATKVLECGESGLYRCVAENGVDKAVEKDLDVRVVCPPRVDENAGPLSAAKISPMGQVRVSVPVKSDPAVTDFRLFKHQRRQYDGSDHLIKEFHRNDFIANVKYNNDNDSVNVVNVSTFDPDPCTECFYTLTLINGVEPPLNVSFNSSLVQGAFAGRMEARPGASSVVYLYVVCAIAAVVVVVMVVGVVVYVKVYQRESRTVKKSKAQENRRSASRYSMDGRMWMTNQGFY